MECPNCRAIENGVWRCFDNEGTEQNSNQIQVDAQAVPEFHGLVKKQGPH